jgi:hypothetical protein
MNKDTPPLKLAKNFHNILRDEKITNTHNAMKLLANEISKLTNLKIKIKNRGEKKNRESR